MSINVARKISTDGLREDGEPTARHRAIAVVAAGSLLGLSFPPYPFAPLAWISLVPLFFVWDRTGSWRSAYLDSVAAFVVTFAVAFQWPLFHVHAKTAILSAPFLLLLPAWMAVPFGVSHWIRRRLGRTAGIAALLSLFLVMELALRRGPLAFPWPLLGHTQAVLPPLNQLASVGGVPLLSLFVLLLNAGFFVAVKGRTAAGLGGSALLLGAALVVSAVHPNSTSTGPVVRVGIVQPSISAAEWASTEDTARVELLRNLSEGIAGASDLVVWPETALFDPAEFDPDLETPLITGAVTRAGAEYQNSALLYRSGLPTDMYHKTRLVPFAEHVPYRERFAWLERLAIPAGGTPGYLPGRGVKVFEIPEARLGVLICFESLFDDVARDLARKGAGILIVITQDGWWGNSFGYRQHLAFNRLRAIESGLPLVQVSVSGYSAVITSDGTVVKRYDWMTRGGWVETVRSGNSATIFSRTGDVLSPTALIISLMLLGLSAVAPRPASPKYAE